MLSVPSVHPFVYIKGECALGRFGPSSVHSYLPWKKLSRDPEHFKKRSRQTQSDRSPLFVCVRVRTRMCIYVRSYARVWLCVGGVSADHDGGSDLGRPEEVVLKSRGWGQRNVEVWTYEEEERCSRRPSVGDGGKVGEMWGDVQPPVTPIHPYPSPNGGTFPRTWRTKTGRRIRLSWGKNIGLPTPETSCLLGNPLLSESRFFGCKRTLTEPSRGRISSDTNHKLGFYRFCDYEVGKGAGGSWTSVKISFPLRVVYRRKPK